MITTFNKFGLDTRGVRFPGLISNETLPGGGTTDYAVDIYYKAIKEGKYTSYIAEGTYMDMMYMPDALQAIVDLMEADASKLIHRNAFNVTAMSFEPEQIAASIRKEIPTFTMDYEVDPVRQAIANSWPDSIDATAAKEEWGFSYKYDLDAMTKDMLTKLAAKQTADLYKVHCFSVVSLIKSDFSCYKNWIARFFLLDVSKNRRWTVENL